MGDLMKTEDCTRAVDEAIAAFGGLDVRCFRDGRVIQ